MQRFQILFVFTIILSFLSSCSADKLNPDAISCGENISFNEDIVFIIRESCAYSGCHDGASAPGDYTSYDAMLPVLDDTEFRNRVVEVQDMPPSYASGPTELSTEELILIRCWLESGYQR